MGRTGGLIALAIAAAVGLAFAFYPELDLKLAGLFYDPESPYLWVVAGYRQGRLRTAAAWLIALIAAPAFVAFAGRLILPRRPMWLPGRAVLLMIVTLALAPGLLANVVLKDHWGRPRPIDVTEFGGLSPF